MTVLLTLTPGIFAKPPAMKVVEATKAWWLERLERPEVGTKEGPAIFGCLFKQGAESKDFNQVDVCTAVVLDFDHPDSNTAQRDALNKFPYHAITYSTYSATESIPKFRFVMPLKEPLKPTQYEALWHLVNKELGEMADLSAKDATRLSYLPRLSSEEARALYLYHYQEGELFDWREHFDRDPELAESLPYIARATSKSTPGLPDGLERPDWWDPEDDVARRARAYLLERGVGVVPGERHSILLRTGCELWWDWAFEREIVSEILHEVNDRFSPPKTEREVEREVEASFQRCRGQYAVKQLAEYGHWLGGIHVDGAEIAANLIATVNERSATSSAQPSPHVDAPPDEDPPLIPTPFVDDEYDIVEAPAVHVDIDSQFPMELLQIGGLGGEIAEWVESCSKRHTPILSFGATLSLLGAAAGRSYETRTKVRTNIYVVAIAPTASGKDNGRQCITEILDEADKRFVGAGGFASAAGLLRELVIHPVRLFALDEFGAMLKAFSSPRASNFEREIITTMMELTGSAYGTFLGKAYAERERERITQPHAVIYATTAPDQFYDSLAGADVVNGFLNRLIVLEAPRNKKKEPTGDPTHPPKNIVDRIKAICDGVHLGTGGNIQKSSDHVFDCKPNVIKVATEDDGARRQQEILEEEIERGIKNSDMWGRVNEQVMRLALIRAISRNFMMPAISGDDVSWASSVVLWQTRRFVKVIHERVSENDVHKLKQQVLMAIRSHGPGAKVSKTEIAIGCRGIDKTKRSSVLEDLLESGAIATDVEMTGGRSRKVYWITGDMQ